MTSCQKPSGQRRRHADDSDVLWTRDSTARPVNENRADQNGRPGFLSLPGDL
jgi:hypothetical protein